PRHGTGCDLSSLGRGWLLRQHLSDVPSGSTGEPDQCANKRAPPLAGWRGGGRGLRRVGEAAKSTKAMTKAGQTTGLALITDCHIHIQPVEMFKPHALELIKKKRANFDEIVEFCRSPKA